jgi:hypothetical protein
VTYLNRTVEQVIDFGVSQIENPTQDWSNLCQSFCRQAYGVAAWSPSAKEAWFQIPQREKTVGGHPSDAPRGALIYFTKGTYGHVAIATGKSTSDKCLSNDYVRQGMINYAPRDFPRWGMLPYYGGWSTWTPYGSLRLEEPAGMWDGNVPDPEGIFNAMNHGYKNPAAYRLACRLYDLGLYAGKPQPEGEQGYPLKAVINAQQRMVPKVNPAGAYSPELHEAIFR